MPKVHALPTDACVDAAIRLLEMLSSSPARTMSRADAIAALGVTADQLDEVAEIVGQLADRSTGARAALAMDGDSIALIGDAATMRAVRLTTEEGMVLAHILDVLDIAPDARQRIATSLLPAGTAGEPVRDGLGDVSLYGSFYQQISEAITDGVRLRMSYRSHSDAAARERMVDPGRIESEGSAAYLVAWDVEVDEERRYRMDRIASVTFTDDSAENHAWSGNGTRESLSALPVATVVCTSASYARQLDWAGIESVDVAADGSSTVRVHYASPTWIFDRVLGSAGALTIAEPDDLRAGFSAYAQRLLRDPLDS